MDSCDAQSVLPMNTSDKLALDVSLQGCVEVNTEDYHSTIIQKGKKNVLSFNKYNMYLNRSLFLF